MNKYAKDSEPALDGFLMVQTEVEFELRRLEVLGVVKEKVAKAVPVLMHYQRN